MQEIQDNNSQLDTVQVGKVNGVFTARPLNGEVLDKIEIDYNGVVGWDKAMSLISFDYLTLVFLIKSRTTEDDFPEIVSKLKSGLLPFYAHQICLADSSIADFLKDYRIAGFRPGIINEQIYVDGVKLNALHTGSTIQIGNDVKLEVVSGRTLCPIFFQHLQFENVNVVKKVIQETINVRHTRQHPPIGVMCRVVKTGQVKPNDTVIADPSTSNNYKKGICINRNGMVGPHLEYDYQSQIKWLNKEEVKTLYEEEPELLNLTLEHFDNYKIPEKEDCVFYVKGTVKDKKYPSNQHIDKRELRRRLGLEK